IGSLRKGPASATDALQFYGFVGRSGGRLPAGDAELPSRRLQHEHSMVVVRDAPMRLAAHARATGGFFGLYREHHAAASSPDDVERVGEILALPEAKPELDANATTGWGRPSSPPEAERSDGAHRVTSLFTAAPSLETLDLSDAALRALFPSPWRHVERDDGGALLSLFSGDAHVVLRRKQHRVLRPHG